MDNLKTIITGGTGWLGKELTRILIDDYNYLPANLALISSNKNRIIVNKKIIHSKTFKDFNSTSFVDTYYDFAFLTREKIHLIGPKKYKEINEKIISNSVKLVNKLKPKNVVLASSGAVYKIGKNWRETSNFLYSDLKILHENKLREICAKTNSNLIIARIFNLSGTGIIDSNRFAISQLVESALHNSEILIKSNYLVTRKYCDISQLLNMLVAAVRHNHNDIFDTSGVKIELRELSKKIVKELNSFSKIISPEISSKLVPDDYFSRSKKYDRLLMEFLGEKTISIEDQILKTKNGLTTQAI